MSATVIMNEVEAGTTVSRRALLNYKASASCGYIVGTRNRWNKHTKEECVQCSARYSTRMEWYKSCRAHSAAALKRGWYEECTSHMLSSFYTREECMESAAPHSTLKSWKKENQSAYKAASANGWLSDCRAHMKVMFSSHTKEECMASAAKFSTNQEWAENENKYRAYALRKGWLKDCSKHFTKKLCAATFLVYRYRFSDGFSYVGITRNEKARKRSHTRSGPVAEHSQKTGLIPEYAVVERGILSTDGPLKEEYYVLEEAKNHKLLNIAKPGSLGPNVGSKYTLEICKKIGSKYNSRYDWQHSSDASSYIIAHAKGWIDECCPRSVRLSMQSNESLIKMCEKAVKLVGSLEKWEKRNDRYIQHLVKRGLLEGFKTLYRKSVINASTTDAQLTSTVSIT